MPLSTWDIFIKGYSDYWNYLQNVLFNPSWDNFFYVLMGVSLLVWGLELLLPWRKEQNPIRKDFWKDGFYMLFNVFVFSLLAYNALSEVAVHWFDQFLGLFGLENIVAIKLYSMALPLQMLIYFIIADFLQWNIHRLLHRVPFLWEFHKLHHSVKEMGFAAHLRFHWMETFVYRILQFIPLTMIGANLEHMFMIYSFTLLIGHLNHANLNWNYGLLGYILNNPAMHIWHHAKELPAKHKYGANYGLTLSLWDYLFKTAHLPGNGKNIELGFKNDEKYPQPFLKQITYPFFKK